MATISYQPWYQGATDPAWDIPLNTDAGADDLIASNINQASFTMTFRSTNGQDTLGTGTFTVKATSPAEVYYQPSAADVAATFTGYLFIKAHSNDNPARTIVWDPVGGIGNTLSSPVPFVIVAS